MRLSYDFHIHSCLSLCAADEMTPANIVNMAKVAGLSAIAISDHQSAKNVPAAMRAGKEAGILVVPAIELMTREEVHVLCLFSELDAALDFSAYILKNLTIGMENDPAHFRQHIMDEFDNVIGVENLYLGDTAEIGIYDLPALMREYGGVPVPAHVDRPSHSLVSNLGFYDEGMGFSVFERTENCDLPAFIKAHPEFREKPFLINSDAHELVNIQDPMHYIEVETASPAAVVAAVRAGSFG